MKNATAVERPLARPISCAERCQPDKPHLTRARRRCPSTSRELRARAFHALNVRRSRSAATLRRCQRLTITIATATAAVSSIAVAAAAAGGALQKNLGTVRRKRDRLATAAAFRFNMTARATRQLLRAACFVKASALAVRESSERRWQALLAVRVLHFLRDRHVMDDIL